MQDARAKCYRCYRPQSSCMCPHVRPVQTRTRFVILMHPKEYRKIKNGTGHLTHLSLPNSELHIGIDFSTHQRVNALISDPMNNCYLLYPSKESVPLNRHSVTAGGKQTVIFVLDATWDCSKKMLTLSRNLQDLQHISFEHDRRSRFEIKAQPEVHCLSTIESTLCVLELLNAQGDEAIEPESLKTFLNPFFAMIRYQKSCVDATGCSIKNAVRFKKRSN